MTKHCDVRCPAQHGPGDRMRRQQLRDSAELRRHRRHRPRRPRRAAEPAAPPATPAPARRRRRHRRRVNRVRPSRPASEREPASASGIAASTCGARRSTARPPSRRSPVYRDVSAAVGTALSLSLITPLSTETAKVETPVTARLRQPIVVDGFTVCPPARRCTAT